MTDKCDIKKEPIKWLLFCSKHHRPEVVCEERQRIEKIIDLYYDVLDPTYLNQMKQKIKG